VQLYKHLAVPCQQSFLPAQQQLPLPGLQDKTTAVECWPMFWYWGQEAGDKGMAWCWHHPRWWQPVRKKMQCYGLQLNAPTPGCCIHAKAAILPSSNTQSQLAASLDHLLLQSWGLRMAKMLAQVDVEASSTLCRICYEVWLLHHSQGIPTSNASTSGVVAAFGMTMPR